MKKFLIFLLILIFVIVVGILLFRFKGYKVYNEITTSKSIESIVNKLKEDEDYVTLDNLPKDYINAVIAVEDHRYYEHGSYDIIALFRALTSNLKSGEINEGGSTITQQVAKNMYFMDGSDKYDGTEKKLAEFYVAKELEDKYSKDEILEFYVNSIYFGQSNYGIREASKYYYDKEPKDMDLDESSLLAGVPNAPSLYNPVDSEELARNRQKKVLSDMVQYGYINQSQMDEIINKHETK